MINGIKSWMYADEREDRVSISIGDGLGAFKTIEVTPKDAHDIAIEILTSAFSAKGMKDFSVLIGVATDG